MRWRVSRKPESQYSPRRGRINHVRTKVSQYAMRQATNVALSGSHKAVEVCVSAQSMGTRRTMEQGRNRARKTGSSSHCGVCRRGR